MYLFFFLPLLFVLAAVASEIPRYGIKKDLSDNHSCVTISAAFPQFAVARQAFFDVPLPSRL